MEKKLEKATWKMTTTIHRFTSTVASRRICITISPIILDTLSM